MKMNNKHTKAFTLIEIMIVVAIIGIVATLAFVNYQRNLAASQASEAFTLLGAARSTIDDAIGQSGQFPTDAQFTVLLSNQSGQFVSDIVADEKNFTLTAVFKNSTSPLIAGKEVAFQRDPTSGDWFCKITISTIDDSVLPQVCD